jgi:hypothetical protein
MHREPFWEAAARVWALVELRQVNGFIAAHSFTTLFYLYRRQSDHEAAYQAIRRLLQVFAVAAVDQAVIKTASNLGWKDFEDAVQYTSAQACGCKYLITRNPQDYPDVDVAVLKPSEFLALWATQ